MSKNTQTPTKTDDREKIALWMDTAPLAALRAIQKTVGVSVSESNRRAVDAYLKGQKS